VSLGVALSLAKTPLMPFSVMTITLWVPIIKMMAFLSAMIALTPIAKSCWPNTMFRNFIGMMFWNTSSGGLTATNPSPSSYKHGPQNQSYDPFGKTP
jgi:hypothetical protein